MAIGDRRLRHTAGPTGAGVVELCDAAVLSSKLRTTSSGGIDFLRRVTDVFSVMRRPFAAAVSAMIVPIIPLGHLIYQGVSAIMPDGDKRVFADPEIEAMFIDDIVLAACGGFQALVARRRRRDHPV